MKKIPDWKINISTIFLIVFLISCFLFLIFIGIDAIEGKINFEFYADTETYMALAREKYSYAELFLINSNLVGPYTILRLLNDNYYLVFFLNCTIFCYFFFTLSNLYNLNRQLFLFILVISPVMFGSLIGINKEIFALQVLTHLLIYNKKRKYIHVLFAILFSFIVRWQMCLFVVTFIAVTGEINPLKSRRLICILLLLLAISIIYPLNLDKFEGIDSVATEARENKTEGSGLFSLLIVIQNHPLGYLIVFIPKALFLLGGILFRYYKFFDFSDLYNNFFTFIQSLITIILLGFMVKKKIGIKNDFVFMGIIYCIIFCLSPIYSPRYLFPFYILLALALTEKKPSNLILY